MEKTRVFLCFWGSDSQQVAMDRGQQGTNGSFKVVCVNRTVDRLGWKYHTLVTANKTTFKEKESKKVVCKKSLFMEKISKF